MIKFVKYGDPILETDAIGHEIEIQNMGSCYNVMTLNCRKPGSLQVIEKPDIRSAWELAWELARNVDHAVVTAIVVVD